MSLTDALTYSINEEKLLFFLNIIVICIPQGKEIELEQILDLNPDLAPQDAPAAPPNKVQKYAPRPSVPAAGTVFNVFFSPRIKILFIVSK